MHSLRSHCLAASVAVLCTGIATRLHAGHPLSETAPAYGPLDGTLALELGFTADRIEGRVNLLTPLYRDPNGKSMFFLDGNWSGKGDGNENGSAGVGFRHRFDDPDLIVGLNAFYDYGDYSGRGYHQFGVGFELLSKWIDFRANGYFPSRVEQPFAGYSTTHSLRGTTATSSSSVVLDGGEGNPDLLQTTTTTTRTRGTRHRSFERHEASLPGFDLELGGLIPYLDCWAETRIFAGYAYFDDPFGHDISCFTARLESRPVPAVVFDAQYKGDARLLDGDHHWFFGARVEIPFDLGNLLHGQSPFAGITAAFTPQGRCWRDDAPYDGKKALVPAETMRNRMNEQIVRNWRPTISRTGYEKASDQTVVQTDPPVRTVVNQPIDPPPQ